ncbi:hypothetical protein EWF20_12885 [Sulfolobus sp. S-194]|nr:hypothetical protein EWF20_12885 [Sulfolobus sp. S-194]
MVFWDNYRLVELGTKVNLEEFISNKELKEKVKRGIRGLYEDVINEIERCIGKRDEEAIWDLAKSGKISPNNIQEFLDIIYMINNIDKIDDVILYGMLVRIMEDLEELYINLKC